MGMSTAANRATKALRLARTSGSAGTRRRARYPRKSTSSTAVLVSRASHAHHTPQVGLPQIDPEINVHTLNTTPTSTEAAANRSQTMDRVRGQRYKRLQPAASPKARYRATQATPGWMYTNRTRSPWV